MKPRFVTVLLGEEPLLVQCGDVLRELGHDIIGVVTTTPTNVQWATGHGIPVWAKHDLEHKTAEQPFDLLLSITWPWLIDEHVIARARRAAINYHDGPLPQYAGMNGSAWALYNGEVAHAVVWHQLTAGLDAGDIFQRRDVVFEAGETSLSLNIKNASLALQAFVSLMGELERGVESPTPQNPQVVRSEYSRHTRPPHLGLLDWRLPAKRLDQAIRACDFGPYKNRFGSMKIGHGEAVVVVKLASAEAFPPEGPPAVPGTVLALPDDKAPYFDVVCGEGVLRIQRCVAGDGRVLLASDAAAFLRLREGCVLDPAPAVTEASRVATARAEAVWERHYQAVAQCEAFDASLVAVPLEAQEAHKTAGHLRVQEPGVPEAAWLSLLTWMFTCIASKGPEQRTVPLRLVLPHTLPASGLPASLFAPGVDTVSAIQNDDTWASLVGRTAAQLERMMSLSPPLMDAPLRLAPSLAAAPPMVVVAFDADGRTAGLPADGKAGLHIAIDDSGLRLTFAPAFAGVATLISSHARALLAQLTASTVPLRDVDVALPAEREQLLVTHNATDAPFVAERIFDGFCRQVPLRNDAVALLFEGEKLTYQALEARANRLANALIARGAGPGTCVTLCLPRGLDLVVAMLGISKTGAAYVPLDQSLPTERARFIVEDTQAIVTVTAKGVVDKFAGLPVLLSDSPDVVRASPLAPMCHATPDDVCYIIFTSGSTGTPKGVVLTHRAVCNTLQWVNHQFSVTENDTVLFVTSPAFDLSVYDVFGILAAGATIDIASAERLAEPQLLLRKLIEPGVTIWDSAPPALARLLPFLPKHAPSSTLRLVMLSGDTIAPHVPATLYQVFDQVEVKALGGATEAAIWSNWHDIEREAVPRGFSSVPYGKPIQNARYYVLSAEKKALPFHVAGDLWIAGACVAQGYFHRPELTAERFIESPFVAGEKMYQTGDIARVWPGGVIEFLGRKDHQVKVRGYRVELGEIEAALLRQPEISHAVCIARRDSVGEKNIVAYVVKREGSDVDGAVLRQRLLGFLPDFMVPSFVVLLKHLPLSSSGKVDRHALPEPRVTTTHDEPSTKTEQALVRVWEQVLHTSPIGTNDNFFDLGGHSLLAALLVTRMKNATGVLLPLSRLVSGPTIKELAQEIDTHKEDTGSVFHHLIPLRTEGSMAPLFLIAGIGGHVFGLRELALRLPQEQPVYALRALGSEGEDFVHESGVEDIANVYEDEIVRKSQGQPVVIGGYSFGALVAFELTRRLRQKGVEVQRTVLLDVFAPGYPHKEPVWRRAVLHAEHFTRKSPAEQRRYLKDRAKNVLRRQLIHYGFGAWVADGFLDIDADKRERMREMWGTLARAQALYAPAGNDPGPATLFRATVPPDWPGVRLDDATHGWRRFITGPLDVIDVPGDHLQLLTGDNLDRVGRALSERLLKDHLRQKR